MLTRRLFVVTVPAGLLAAPACALVPVHQSPSNLMQLHKAVLDAETATGGRIGLAVDFPGGLFAQYADFRHRGNELFPMASTFKLLLAAAVLYRVDAGKERLDRAIPVRAADLVGHSPVAARHVGGTATVAQLAEAAITHSDNAAANLLLPAVGGPAGLTAWLRSIGDKVTRLDRIEPFLNEALPDDPRDTTSPDTMLNTLKRLLDGNVLSAGSSWQLRRWLIANTTGGERLRAGLPKGWIVGDKTGTGGNNSVNDIAIAWPNQMAHSPLYIACFLNGGTATAEVHNRTHADLARAIVAAMAAEAAR